MSASIIKNRNFIFMWFGHLISHAGDAVFMIALPWLMLDITGSKSLTSLVSMSAYLPAVLFGLFAGVVVDRYNRKRIMIYSDILRALLVAVIPLALIYGFISPLLIGGITFLLSTFSAFFYPARDSLIPHIVTVEELPAANSAISVSGQMSHLLGPLFAGIGISIFGIKHLFTVDAISFLFSILLISLIVVPARKITIGKYPPKWEGIVEGLTYVNSHKGLRILLILTFVNNIFIMGPAIIGVPVFVREVLTSNFEVLAKLEVSMAAGMIVGSFVFWKVGKNTNPIVILLFGIVMDGVTYTFLFFAKTPFIAILILFIHGIGIPLITVSRTTIIQAVVPNEFRGRLFSMIYMAVMGTTAISVGLTGFILEFIGVELLFLLIGVGAASTVLIGINPALRGMDVKNRLLNTGKK